MCQNCQDKCDGNKFLFLSLHRCVICKCVRIHKWLRRSRVHGHANPRTHIVRHNNSRSNHQRKNHHIQYSRYVYKTISSGAYHKREHSCRNQRENWRGKTATATDFSLLWLICLAIIIFFSSTFSNKKRNSYSLLTVNLNVLKCARATNEWVLIDCKM